MMDIETNNFDIVMFELKKLTKKITNDYYLKPSQARLTWPENTSMTR